MRSLIVVLLAAVAPLVNSGTESKWTVTKGTAQLGTVTFLTSASAGRVEFKASAKAAPIAAPSTWPSRLTPGHMDTSSPATATSVTAARARRGASGSRHRYTNIAARMAKAPPEAPTVTPAAGRRPCRRSRIRCTG